MRTNYCEFKRLRGVTGLRSRQLNDLIKAIENAWKIIQNVVSKQYGDNNCTGDDMVSNFFLSHNFKVYTKIFFYYGCV